MGPGIDQTVFSWSNFLLKLFRQQAPKQFVRSFHVGLPPAECGIDERLLCSHSLPGFHLNESHVLSRACSWWESAPHQFAASCLSVRLIETRGDIGYGISIKRSIEAFRNVSDINRSVTRSGCGNQLQPGKVLKNLSRQWSPLPHYASNVKRQKPLDKSGRIGNVVVKDSDLRPP